MAKQRPSLLYGLLSGLGLIIVTLAVARAAGWLGVVERLAVDLAIAERRDMEAMVSAHGTVQAAQPVVIRSDLSGQLLSVPVAEGDAVEAGQLLAVIRAERTAAQLAGAQAVVHQRQATWAEARAQAQAARVRAQQAEGTFRRNQTLHRRGVIADAAWEQAQADCQAARQAARAAHHRANIAHHAVEEAQAEAQQAEQNQTLTHLYAPRRGTVVQRIVTTGEQVTGTGLRAGSVLFYLANLEQLEVHFMAEEDEVLSIAEGQRAEVRWEALPGRVVGGTVAQVAYRAEGSALGGSVYRVRVALDAVPESLRIGMTAEVDIVTQAHRQVLTVPLLAASPRPNPNAVSEADSLKEVVFVYARGKVAQRTVTTGIHNREYIEISSGLEAGETVVSGPYRAVFRELRDGTPVRGETDRNNTRQTLAGGP